MKPCNNCNLLKADEDYVKDVTREDGLSLICRDCNKLKCKQWYTENRERKKQLALAYKQEHGHAPAVPVAEKRKRETVKQAAQQASEPDDWQMVRFSQSEWLHCLEEGRKLGIDAQAFVRNLVRDDRDRKTRRAALLKSLEERP